jgi:hypothetical protein
MKIRFTLLIVATAALLAPSAFCQEGSGELTPLPSEKRIPGKDRTFTEIPVSELEEGSFEWIFRKIMMASRDGDFDTLKQLSSPHSYWSAKQTSREAMAIITALDFDGTMRVDDRDRLVEEDRAYVYMGFRVLNTRRALRMNYVYFLKVEGRWIKVGAQEWQTRKLYPAPAE